MSRLTKKLEPPYEQVLGQDYVYTSNTRLTLSFASVEQKLGQLEDYEDNIGMSIATILDTLQNGYGIVVKNTQGIRRYTYHSKCYLTFGYDEYNGWYFTYKSSGMPQYFIKDYGKTWALTKEELE